MLISFSKYNVRPAAFHQGGLKKPELAPAHIVRIHWRSAPCPCRRSFHYLTKVTWPHPVPGEFCASPNALIMAFDTILPAYPATEKTTISMRRRWRERFTDFADRQKESRAMWFFGALLIQGVIFIPLPAFLVYYYDASVTGLLITMTCFFTTIIAFMGGAGIRTVIFLALASMLIELISAVAVILW